jgi:hypothetical protein
LTDRRSTSASSVSRAVKLIREDVTVTSKTWPFGYARHAQYRARLRITSPVDCSDQIRPMRIV